MTSKVAFQVTAGILFLSVLLSLSPSQEIATQPPPIETMADLEAIFAHEPSYVAIQQTAMRFAEVHPDKIAAWRRNALYTALLPRIRFSYELDKDLERATSTQMDYSISFESSHDYEYGMSSERGYNQEYGRAYSEKPGESFGWEWSLAEENTTRSGMASSSRDASGEDTGEYASSGYYNKDSKSRNWGIMLEWDLRDFLYSREQTYISREARELVELRQDVLEEVNTYFFDRRRAQIELLFSPPSDIRSRIDLQLRIARLTANIDALTGGYLSKQLQLAQTPR